MDTALPLVILSSTTEFGGVEASISKTLLVDLTLTVCSSIRPNLLRQAPINSQAAERAPVHLVAIVDTSGSMEGEKLNLVQDRSHPISCSGL